MRPRARTIDTTPRSSTWNSRSSEKVPEAADADYSRWLQERCPRAQVALTADAVATASSEQVRQPLNRKGIGSAEPYRQWLGPLIDELGAKDCIARGDGFCEQLKICS